MKFFRETLLNFLNWCINLSLNTQITCSYFVGNAAQSIKTVGCNCNCSQLWAPLVHFKLFSFVFHEDLIFIKCGYSTFGLWGASSCFSIFIHVLLHLTSYCTSLRCSVFLWSFFSSLLFTETGAVMDAAETKSRSGRLWQNAFSPD